MIQHAFWLIYKKMKAEERYGRGGYHCVLLLLLAWAVLSLSHILLQMSETAPMSRSTLSLVLLLPKLQLTMVPPVATMSGK
jgi:hypothetical protein